MLQLEEKSVWWVLGLMSKFSGVVDRELHFFTDAKAVAKACLLYPQHEHFVGHRENKGSVKEAIPGSVDLYIVEVVIFEGGSIVSEEIYDAAHVFLM